MPASRTRHFLAFAAASLLTSTAIAGVEQAPPRRVPPNPEDIAFTSKGALSEIRFEAVDVGALLGLDGSRSRSWEYLLRASIAGTRLERKKSDKECEGRTFDATAAGLGCAYESFGAILARESALTPPRPKAKKLKAPPPRAIRTQSHWDEMAGLSFRDAMRRVNPKSLPEAQALLPFATTAGCKTAMATAALFNQSEEFLPTAEVWPLLDTVYRTVAPCLDPRDPIHEQVHLRKGLLDVMRRNYKGAREALNNALQNQAPAEEYRTLFWRGILEKELKEGATSLDLEWNSYWARLAATYPLSQHAVLVHGIFGEHPLTESEKAGGPTVTPFAGPRWDSLNVANLVFLQLLSRKEKRVASEFAARIAGKLSPTALGPGLFLALANREAGNLRESMRVTFSVARVAGADALHPEIIKLLYPVMYEKTVEKHAGELVEVPLALSLMRQESSFNPRAKSPVGAMGLMQVLPRTARKRNAGLLADPDTNIAEGCRYLRNQLRSFDGNEVLTLAAYNAGPTVTNRWVKRFAGASPLLMADLIPYSETRAYVSGVLRGRFWYRYLLDGVDLEKHAQKELLYASHLLGMQLSPDLASRKSSSSFLSFLARKLPAPTSNEEAYYSEEF